MGEAELKQSEADARDREAEVSELATRRETLARDVERLPEARANLSEFRLKFGDLESQTNAAKVRLGVVREAVDRSERMAREAAELGRKRDERVRERGLYEELAIAFGRNGIQALIIETHCPK